MTPTGSAFGYTILMIAAGIGIPIMASLNATLGVRLSSPTTALMILCTVGALVSGVIALASGLPEKARFFDVPLIYYMAGFLVVFYVLSITLAAPKIGLGNAIFLVLLGQILSAVLIDHFGLLGAVKSAVTIERLFGIGLMVAGIYLARKAS